MVSWVRKTQKFASKQTKLHLGKSQFGIGKQTTAKSCERKKRKPNFKSTFKKTHLQ